MNPPPRDTTRRDSRLDELASIGRQLTGLQSLEEVGRVALRGATSLLGCERVVLVVRRGDEMKVAAVHGLGLEDFANTELRPESINSALREHLGNEYLGVPLVSHEEVVGLLAIDQTIRSDPSEASWLLAAIGDQLALALFHTPDDLIEELEQELRETQEEARLRRLALHGLAHDVRSPLNALQLNLQLFESGALGDVTEDQADVLASMRRSVTQASTLLTQMLELGRQDGSGEAFASEPVDLAEVARHCAEARRAELDARQQQVQVESDETVTVVADRDRLIQLVMNLLGNAIHYSPPESTIVFQTRRRPNRRIGQLTITDSGPGVRPEDRADVFAPYFRASSGKGKKGTGLGLTISREIARRMHGDITLLDSDRGACFAVTLPLSK